MLQGYTMIILVGGEKGGTGKSTLATALAAMRARRGHDVLLVDADPQGTSTIWAEERAAREISPAIRSVSKVGKTFTQDVRDLAARYEDVIIDAGGRDSRELRGGLVLADRFYTPLQPSAADAWTLDRVEDLVDQARALNGRLRAFVVLTRSFTNPNIPETEDALQVLKEYELLAFSGVVIHERVAYRRALGFGMAPEEMEDGDAKTIHETEALYRHAFESP